VIEPRWFIPERGAFALGDLARGDMLTTLDRGDGFAARPFRAVQDELIEQKTTNEKMSDAVQSPPCAILPETFDRLARRALFAFALTFIISRMVVFLIMSDSIPNMFLYMQGTHVHHLNYGIFLLAAVGGYAIFRRPDGRPAEFTALAYGFAMALTFDEFGMWLHLGGSYWQRASVDAVIIVAAIIGLIAYAPSLKRFESHHFWSFVVLVLAVAGFAYVVIMAGGHLGAMVGPTLRELELKSSP
jgi:hypothetical protein